MELKQLLTFVDVMLSSINGELVKKAVLAKTLLKLNGIKIKWWNL